MPPPWQNSSNCFPGKHYSGTWKLGSAVYMDKSLGQNHICVVIGSFHTRLDRKKDFLNIYQMTPFFFFFVRVCVSVCVSQEKNKGQSQYNLNYVLMHAAMKKDFTNLRKVSIMMWWSMLILWCHLKNVIKTVRDISWVSVCLSVSEREGGSVCVCVCVCVQAHEHIRE